MAKMIIVNCEDGTTVEVDAKDMVLPTPLARDPFTPQVAPVVKELQAIKAEPAPTSVLTTVARLNRVIDALIKQVEGPR